MVEDGHVGEHVVDVVGVGGVLVVGPSVGRGDVAVEERVLRLRLVVHAVQTDHVTQEPVQVGVTRRILEKDLLSSHYPAHGQWEATGTAHQPEDSINLSQPFILLLYLFPAR